MPTSTALVVTDTPARYAKQLVSHLGRKSGAIELPDGGFEVHLSAGVGVVRVEGDLLRMDARATDSDALAAVEDVLGRHLVRFGTRQELQVVWARNPADDVEPPESSPEHA